MHFPALEVPTQKKGYVLPVRFSAYNVNERIVLK